ncbi:MAG: DNA polymerase domain-containing protein, partial [Bacteroidota bacterium]
LFLTGVYERILNADIESLYPSIMIQRAIAPAADTLGVFNPILRELVRLRLDAKAAMHKATTSGQRNKFDALQSAFKNLINSFYGYLGYSRALWNDAAKADEVTTFGQELLRAVIGKIDLYNGTVIEVDTDGVYFMVPDNVVGDQAEEAFVERNSSSLPEGINLALTGRYRKMLSYKKKNYALLGYDNELTIRGSSLISRSMERFARQFIRLAISRLLEPDLQGLHNVIVSYRESIIGHQWDVYDFCRTEIVHDSFDRYERDLAGGNRNPSAAYEVTRRAGLAIVPGDRISYYVTGTGATVKVSEQSKLASEWDPNFPDENTAYYLGRLMECCKKFEDFFTPEDFRKLFSTDDLFGFDSGSIQILNHRVEPTPSPPTPGEEGDEPEFRIWLDQS